MNRDNVSIWNALDHETGQEPVERLMVKAGPLYVARQDQGQPNLRDLGEHRRGQQVRHGYKDSSAEVNKRHLTGTLQRMPDEILDVECTRSERWRKANECKVNKTLACSRRLSRPTPSESRGV